MKNRILLSSGIVALLIITCFMFMLNIDGSQTTNIQYKFTPNDLYPESQWLKYVHFIEDDSLIYYYALTESPVYYRYIFAEEKNVLLGEIPNFYIGMDTVAKIDNYIYFVAGILEQSEIKNILYCIDLDNNTLEICSEHIDESLGGVDVYEFDNKVVMLKNIVNQDESIQTYFDIYNPQTNEWQIENSHLWKSYEDDGSAICSFFASRDNLYNLQYEYTNNGETVTCRLVEYDTALSQTFGYALSGDSLDFTHSGRINVMSVNNELFYLRTTSSYGYIGMLENDTIKTLIPSQKYLEKAVGNASDYGDGNIFFSRRSNLIYFYDQSSNQLMQATLDLNPFESLSAVFVDGESILIVCYVEVDDTYSESIYVLPIKTIF